MCAMKALTPRAWFAMALVQFAPAIPRVFAVCITIELIVFTKIAHSVINRVAVRAKRCGHLTASNFLFFALAFLFPACNPGR